jgi:hypothetical protein
MGFQQITNILVECHGSAESAMICGDKLIRGAGGLMMNFIAETRNRKMV